MRRGNRKRENAGKKTDMRRPEQTTGKETRGSRSMAQKAENAQKETSLRTKPYVRVK